MTRQSRSTSPPSYSVDSSPRYQTLPSVSWAYQSKVSSTSSPSAVTVSRTTVAVIPMTSLVSSVTTTSIRSTSPLSSPSYTHRLPGVRGISGLSIPVTKSEGERSKV